MKRVALSFFIVIALFYSQTISAQVNTSKLIVRGWVGYSDFGAKGDGNADDIDAIAATHAFANEHGLTVKADRDAIYYIGGKDHPVNIQTNTDFGNAAFIIDDRDV